MNKNLNQDIVDIVKEGRGRNYTWAEMSSVLNIPESVLRYHVKSNPRPKVPFAESDLYARLVLKLHGIHDYLSPASLEFLADYKDKSDDAENYCHHIQVLTLLDFVPKDKKHLLEGITKYTEQDSRAKLRTVEGNKNHSDTLGYWKEDGIKAAKVMNMKK